MSEHSLQTPVSRAVHHQSQSLSEENINQGSLRGTSSQEGAYLDILESANTKVYGDGSTLLRLFSFSVQTV